MKELKMYQGFNIARYTVVLISAILFLPVAETLAEVQWRPGPAPDGSIKKEYDVQWFNVIETCNLRAKGSDTDEKCDPDGTAVWEEDSGDYIDLPQTVWNGEGVTNGTVAAETTWQKTTPTGESGVTVTATIKDKSTDPHTNANDSNISATKQMYAYETRATLNCTSSNSGSPTATVNQVTGNPQAVTKTLSLAENEISVVYDSTTKTIDAFGSGTWILKVFPATANLGTGGQIAVDIEVDADGVLHGYVFDSDGIDGATTVAVGLSGGTGVSADVGVEFEVGSDTDEAETGLGFAFSSDHLGDDTDDKLENVSSDDPDPLFSVHWDNQTEDFDYSEDVTFRGNINTESKCKAVVEGHANVIGTIYPGATAKAKMKTTGNVAYTVEVPTYEPPSTMPGPEPGYND